MCDLLLATFFKNAVMLVGEHGYYLRCHIHFESSCGSKCVLCECLVTYSYLHSLQLILSQNIYTPNS